MTGETTGVTTGETTGEPLALDAAARFDTGGLRAIVTGAAHGLGLGITSAFAAAGMRVLAFDRDADALHAAASRLGFDATTLVAHPGDTTRPADVAAAVDAAADAFGGLDVLVNCAAIYPTGTLGEVSDDEFASVLDVNVAGYRRFTRAAVGHSGRAQEFSVVNFSSITLYLGIPPGLSSYITSKGAVVGLTHALARELCPAGVRVNAIAPGAFPTRAEDIVEDQAVYDGQVIENQSIKRRGEVADIACAALFLASPASSFVTGQTLAVDGGWTLH